MNTIPDLNKRIRWAGFNKDYIGVITGSHPKGFLVRMDNDKYVIVHECSIKEIL